MRRDLRDAHSFVWIEDLRRDVRYAVRTLARAPLFTLAAILTLAVGIGGTTAVFSLIDAVLLRPLPFPASDRLVVIYEDGSRHGFPQSAVSPVVYRGWSELNGVFDATAAITEFGAVIANNGEPLRVSGRRVTGSFFDVLGTSPLVGRTLTGSDDRPGAGKVVVLSFGLWQRRFGGERGILGRALLINNEQYTVIGVMPRTFQFLESYVGLWVPAAFTAEELTSGGHYLTVIGRMKPGVDHAGVRANLDAIGQRLASALPADRDTPASVVVSLKDEVSGTARGPLTLLLSAVGVVLLITCANLASLLLARAAARGHELALRGALGASRGRVVRQLLTESLLLSACGLGVGVLLARWSMVFLAQLIPPGMTAFAEPAMSQATLAIGAAVALLTGVLFGLTPALSASRCDLTEALKASGRVASGSPRGRGGFVIGEVALTLVLLVTAGLLLQTFHRMRYADLGVHPDGLLTLRTVLPEHRYGEAPRRAAFYDRVLAGVEHLPGVAAAGYTTSVPLEWKGATTGFTIEGRPPAKGTAYDANHRQVSAGYLKAIGTPLVRGRFFDSGDTKQAQPVVIINETMARRYWQGEDPVGRRVTIDSAGGPARWLTIVGIAGDVRQMGLDLPPRPELYLPYRQIDSQPWFAPRDLVVRTAGDPMEIVSAVKAVIRDADPTIAVSNIRTLADVLDEDVAARRVGTTLVAAFAAFALLLAIVGIYGVIAYFVAQHVPEIGVRIALGAAPRDILRLVVFKGVRLALAGIGLGIVGSLIVTRLISSVLFGIAPTDAVTFVAASTLLLLLALLASYLPARRATTVDPIVALRAE